MSAPIQCGSRSCATTAAAAPFRWALLGVARSAPSRTDRHLARAFALLSKAGAVGSTAKSFGVALGGLGYAVPTVASEK